MVNSQENLDLTAIDQLHIEEQPYLAQLMPAVLEKVPYNLGSNLTLCQGQHKGDLIYYFKHS
ncbi:hypothetical protein B6N58_03115 [Legionella micdadei]|nr:hypothetical protein B6N58_03115 [Legionella micdadei]